MYIEINMGIVNKEPWIYDTEVDIYFIIIEVFNKWNTHKTNFMKYSLSILYIRIKLTLRQHKDDKIPLAHSYAV